MKECECGCGTEVRPNRRFIHGHNQRGCKHDYIIHRKGTEHYNWKGGIIKENGYILVRTEGHPKADKHGYYVGQHILIMERYIGRYLNDDELVHHINGVTDDNRIENLQLMTRGEHTKYHHSIGSYPVDAYRISTI